MPTQVVQTINDVFPHAREGAARNLGPGDGYNLRAILNLTREVPAELINITPEDYSRLVRATSTIEHHLLTWLAQGPAAQGSMGDIDKVDAITVIKQVLSGCKDEFPPPATTELLFVTDIHLRENIRSDIGVARRAWDNAEWKAATVLAGATIEALLHWRLSELSPGSVAVQKAVDHLMLARKMDKPDKRGLDWWVLPHYIEVAEHLAIIGKQTAIAARQAKDFRNLIHPGRAARLAQESNRGTAMLTLGALECVVTDLSM
jgi:hypothetical protein